MNITNLLLIFVKNMVAAVKIFYDGDGDDDVLPLAFVADWYCSYSYSCLAPVLECMHIIGIPLEKILADILASMPIDIHY